MIERKLWNGWNKPKAVKWFFIGYLVLHIVLWLKEAEAFEYYSDFRYVKSESGLWEDEEGFVAVRWENLTELLQETNSVIGIVFALIFTTGVAMAVVHRESFWDNWDLTLRRIPRYRGKYLLSKVIAVLIPAIGFSVYYGTQWFYRFRMYQADLQKQFDYFEENPKPYKIKYIPMEAQEFFRTVPIKPVLEMTMYSVLTAMVLLLLNLAVRRMKKDIVGFCVAIAGLVAVVLLFSEVFPIGRMAEIGILFGCIGIITFFTVRHVYVKL